MKDLDNIPAVMADLGARAKAAAQDQSAFFLLDEDESVPALTGDFLADDQPAHGG